jgi:hypothetical protein
MDAVLYFSDEYLARCKQLTPEQILQFLEDFRLRYAKDPFKTRALYPFQPQD